MPYYNHNDHYLPLVLDLVPEPCGLALDVGCGEGRLALQLADRCESAVGIDPDPGSVEAAQAAALGLDNLQLIGADFLAYDFEDAQFDIITAVASIHHLPFRDALDKMTMLLRPGGVLAIIGLYQPTTPLDHLSAIAAVPVNAVLAWTRRSETMAAPATEPTMTLSEIRREASLTLPGSTVKRLLLWRYLLRWDKPTNVI